MVKATIFADSNDDMFDRGASCCETLKSRKGPRLAIWDSGPTLVIHVVKSEQGLLELADIVGGVLDLLFGSLGQRPIAEVETAAQIAG